MAIHDSLGDRMKEYESRNQYYLQKRTPVCIRVDMRAGHTFTRGFAHPFDEVFGNTMVKTMEYCAKNIGNCVFAYCQSDEITFILVDYAKLKTDAWFDYRTDKLCSISASMATMAFNKYFFEEVENWFTKVSSDAHTHNMTIADWDLYKAYHNAIERGAMFDSRCFNIPKEEACNLVYWRQLDATRNSIQMVGQANYPHAVLQGMCCNNIKTMLEVDKGIIWGNYPTRWKRGTAWRRDIGVDYEMPILKGEDRKYVDDVIYVGE